MGDDFWGLECIGSTSSQWCFLILIKDLNFKWPIRFVGFVEYAWLAWFQQICDGKYKDVFVN
jgi:hypothetical protein